MQSGNRCYPISARLKKESGSRKTRQFRTISAWVRTWFPFNFGRNPTSAITKIQLLCLNHRGRMPILIGKVLSGLMMRHPGAGGKSSSAFVWGCERISMGLSSFHRRKSYRGLLSVLFIREWWYWKRLTSDAGRLRKSCSILNSGESICQKLFRTNHEASPSILSSSRKIRLFSIKKYSHPCRYVSCYIYIQ